MKSIVIYYSQSGNTKKIAQAIQKGISQLNGQCDIARLTDIKPEEWVNYDLIGIGSPVWASCPSINVIYHIKSLPPAVQGKHAFFYCTHGALPGRCIIRGVTPLQEKGLTVIGWRDWYGSSSLAEHAKPWYTDGHPDAIDLAEAESFGAAMVEHSRKISQGYTDIIPTLPSPEASDQIYGVGLPFVFTELMPGGGAPDEPEADGHTGTAEQPYPLGIPPTGAYVMELEGMGGGNPNEKSPLVREKRINPEKCTGCGLCAEACFCNNIDASVFPPVFKIQNCEADYFCEGICPTGAIEVDFMPPDPDAKKPGPLSRTLDLAEATGRFRRLVKEEDIGWETPWERATGHPRVKKIP